MSLYYAVPISALSSLLLLSLPVDAKVTNLDISDVTSTVVATMNGNNVSCEKGPTELCVITLQLATNATQTRKDAFGLAEPKGQEDEEFGTSVKVSDIVFFQRQEGKRDLKIIFDSDPLLDSVNLPNFYNLDSKGALPLETGKFQRVTLPIGVGALKDGSLLVLNVKSDVAAIPEPSAVLLFSCGICMLIFQVTRQLKHAA